MLNEVDKIAEFIHGKLVSEFQLEDVKPNSASKGQRSTIKDIEAMVQR